MIGSRKPTSVLLDCAIDDAISIFTKPMANENPTSPHTSVVQDLETWMERPARRSQTSVGGHVHYSVLSILVGFYLLIREGQGVGLAGVLRLLITRTTPEQRAKLGMTVDLGATRAAVILRGLEADATAQEASDGEAIERLEYSRLAKLAAQMFRDIDPSPFHKADILTSDERAEHAKNGLEHNGQPRRRRVRMTNEQRQAIRTDPDHPDRRISEAESQINHRRLLDVMNKITAAVVVPCKPGTWSGDLATDETIIIVLSARHGTGTRLELKISSDPDAEYWPGKRKKGDKSEPDEKTGFGYGLTLIIRMERPYERIVSRVCLGVHIGRPTGGRSTAVEEGLMQAQRHGLLEGSVHRPRLIADRGFSAKDDWPRLLHDYGYIPVMDYSEGMLTEVVIPDVDAQGNPTPGPVIVAGRIRCPGATGLPSQKLLSELGVPTGTESPSDIVERARRTEFLDALAMPQKRPPNPDKSTSRGRPRNGQQPDTWSVCVQCPAAAGKVNCVLFTPPNGRRDPSLPDVPNPPRVDHPDQLGKACRSKYATYHLPLIDLKRLQPLTHGSHAWADAYEPIRSNNERYHSLFRHDSSGGVTDAWTEMRGIAKSGLLLAMAVAVTTQDLERKFASSTANGIPFGPREAARRHRQRILDSIE